MADCQLSVVPYTTACFAPIISRDDGIADPRRSTVPNTPTSVSRILSDDAVIDHHSSIVGDPSTSPVVLVRLHATTNNEPRKSDVGILLQNFDDGVHRSTVHNRRLGIGADNFQTHGDGQILFIGRRADPDCVSRRGQRNGMSDGLARSLASSTIVSCYCRSHHRHTRCYWPGLRSSVPGTKQERISCAS